MKQEMNDRENALGLIGLSSEIVCRTIKCGKITKTITNTPKRGYVEIKVSRKYDEAYDDIRVRYNNQILFDDKFKSKVTGDPKTKTIKISITAL